MQFRTLWILEKGGQVLRQTIKGKLEAAGRSSSRSVETLRGTKCLNSDECFML